MVASLCTSEISSSRNNTTIGKFYFVHQFSARESPLCRTGSVESKTNFQNKSIEASVLHPLHVKHLKINKKAPQFLSLTTLPTCDSQCHAAATVPCPSLYPSILASSSHGCSDPRHCLPTVCYGDVASLCSIFPLSPAQPSPAQPPHCGAASTASTFQFWPRGEEAGDGLRDVQSTPLLMATQLWVLGQRSYIAGAEHISAHVISSDPHETSSPARRWQTGIRTHVHRQRPLSTSHRCNHSPEPRYQNVLVVR